MPITEGYSQLPDCLASVLLTDKKTAIANCQGRLGWYIFGGLKVFTERQADGSEDCGDRRL
jgi:hypothetical protein